MQIPNSSSGVHRKISSQTFWEEKYKLLEDDYNSLSIKLQEMENQEKIEQKKHIEFSEKIDELNQETDTLLEEIDKWQT